MSKLPGKAVRAWLDHYPMHGAISGLDFDFTQELPDVTCLSDVGGRVVVGNYRHAHALRGFFNGSSSQLDAVGHALMGTTSDHYLLECFAGTTEGCPTYESAVQASGHPTRVAVAGAILQDVPVSGAGGLSRGMVLGNATILAASSGVSVDQGANSSGVTYQAVYRFMGGTYTNLQMRIDHSTDGVTWGDPSLTATSTGNDKTVRVATTAAIYQYKRMVAVAYTGSTSDGPQVIASGGTIIGSGA